MGSACGETVRGAPAPGYDPGVSGDVTVSMLRVTFADWAITEAPGVYVARREGDFAPAGPRSLLVGCVTAPTPRGLADHLCFQAWLGNRTPDELEAVWREGPAAVLP